MSKTTTHKLARKPRIILRSNNYIEDVFCPITRKGFTVGWPFALFLNQHGGQYGTPVSPEAALRHGFTMMNPAALDTLLALASCAITSGEWQRLQRRRQRHPEDVGCPF
jgi:hypothetical protein